MRSLAKHLAVPNEFSQRQPFPGPGLLVRCIGEVKKPKLDILKRVTSIVEDRLGAVGSNQYFAAIIENKFANEPLPKALRKVAAEALDLPEGDVRAEAFMDRVTGVKGDERSYGRLASIDLRPDTREAFGWLHDKLNVLQSSIVESFKDITRVAMLVKDRRSEGQYSILIRAVSTRDYMTASVTPISWKTLKDTAEEVLKSSERIGRVYYDITPKPPATIEFE